MKYSIRELETWQKIGIACGIIIIPGFIGWLIEFWFAFWDNGMQDWYWRGGNFLPWINMYSIGSFLILACTYKFRDKPLKVLLISLLVAGTFELTTGFIFDKVFGLRYWNYKNEILNFHGYVCLLSLSGFAVGGLFLNYMLMPFLIKLSKKIPKKIFLTVGITLVSLILIDEIYNLVFTNLFNLPDALDIYSKYTFFKY